jgi:hypothetical protein
MTNDTLPYENVPPLFPLDTIGQGLDRLILSSDDFDPNGEYKIRFGIYTTPNPKPGRVGEVVLSRTRTPEGNFLLTFTFKKQHTSGMTFAGGYIRMVNDPLALPDGWVFGSWLETANETILPATRLQKQFSTVETNTEKTILRCKTTMNDDREQIEEITIDGPYALSFGLLDSVQRLPGAEMEPFSFTLIDHFDQIKPEHTLRYRGTVDVPVESETIPMTVYDQTGRGVLPLTYYVDPNGCLTAMVSGLEAYIREPVEE